MSSETITTALFLITAVIAAGVLINAVYPVVYNMAGTFSSTTHESDVRIRTDFKVITTFAITGTPGTAQIWMKNIGSERIPLADIKRSDVFCGAVGNFDRLAYADVDPASLYSGEWTEDFSSPKYDLDSNGMWDPGETVKITAKTTIPASGNRLFFQFSLPNGVWRSNEFTVS
jgi:archaeal flagellar protein FlaG